MQENSRLKRHVACAASFALMAFVTSQSHAQTYSPQCPIAGIYSLVGSLPGGGGSYRGEAMVTAQDQGCFMKWYPPNDSSGTGYYVNGELTIHFRFAAGGGTGVVKYTRTGDGTFSGVWWMNANRAAQGSESLTLVRRAR